MSCSTSSQIFLVVPYSRGIRKSFKNVCDKTGVQVHFKGSNTIKNLLVVPKDKDSITNKEGVIYRYKCDNVGCTVEYIGKIGRTFEDRYMVH